MNPKAVGLVVIFGLVMAVLARLAMKTGGTGGGQGGEAGDHFSRSDPGIGPGSDSSPLP